LIHRHLAKFNVGSVIQFGCDFCQSHPNFFLRVPVDGLLNLLAGLGVDADGISGRPPPIGAFAKISAALSVARGFVYRNECGRYVPCMSACTRVLRDLSALYLHYLYLLGIVPKGKQKPLSPAMSAEVRKLDRCIEQCRFICREKLNTAPEVSDFIGRKETLMAERKQDRVKIYNHLRRCNDPETVEALKSERDALTREIDAIRKQIRLANAVVKSAPSIKENIREEQRLKTQMRDETGRYYREHEAKKKEIRSRGWER
jgi:hypothetical protein